MQSVLASTPCKRARAGDGERTSTCFCCGVTHQDLRSLGLPQMEEPLDVVCRQHQSRPDIRGSNAQFAHAGACQAACAEAHANVRTTTTGLCCERLAGQEHADGPRQLTRTDSVRTHGRIARPPHLVPDEAPVPLLPWPSPLPPLVCPVWPPPCPASFSIIGGCRDALDSVELSSHSCQQNPENTFCHVSRSCSWLW